MIFRVLRSVLIVALTVVSPFAVSGDGIDKAGEAKLRAALESSKGGLKVGSVRSSEIAGLFEVQFINGPLVYANAQGKHFIVGDLFAVEPDGYVNLGERRRDGERVDKLAAVALDDMIVFSPKGEPKTYITVFTDVTCFYCQKLHKEVPQLNEQGVEVRYLAYPRAGVGSDGYSQLVSAWCADKPTEAMDRLKNKQSIPQKSCADNPITAQYQLGQELGVRGTPAIVTQDGKMIPGYQSADELMVTLGLN